MEDNIGKLSIVNGVMMPSEKAKELKKLDNDPIYEAIRVIDKVPIFFEDHYLRLENSYRMLGRQLGITAGNLKSQILELATANGVRNFNVMVLLLSGENSEKCVLYVRKCYYPTREEIEKGAKVSILHIERDNPHLKQINTDYQKKAAKRISETNSFEVLLVNRDNKITEGSKSNVFFVKNDKVVTAPEKYILKGVTRKHIIDTCRRSGIQVVEELTDVRYLEQLEGLFISGTSINVFPISAVDDIRFKSFENPVISIVRREFDRFIAEYVKSNSN